MAIRKIGAIIVMVVLYAGLQGGFANADDLDTPVLRDAREFTIEKMEDEEQLTVSKGWRGTGLSVKELVDRGVIVESEVDVEALLAAEPATGGLGAEVLIAPDSRMRTYTQAYPARAVVLITFDVPGGSARCTGWLISADTVATAGHCVHSGGPGGVWYTNFQVFPGYDNSAVPPNVYGTCGWSWVDSVLGWTDLGKEQYDYGVIKLDCNVGNTTGWFGFFWKKGRTALQNFPTGITGYPGDKTLEQWQSHDKVKKSSGKQIFYYNDSFGGMSGSPVWYDEAKIGLGPMAMGIHAYGFPHGSKAHKKFNHGTRITRDRFNNLLFWISVPP